MGKSIMEVHGIVKKFSGVTALDGVNLNVTPGRIHALLGENGAGKSTLMNILSGVYPPTDGEIIWKGQPVHFRNSAESKKLGIAMVHQELSLAPHLSVMENIFIGNLPKKKSGIVDYKQLNEQAVALLSRVNLDASFASKKISDLSVSQQQMVEIAKALALNAELLIMDEPTSCLTANETETLLSIMRQLRDEGVSIIFISHRMGEIFSVCDDITVLRDGKSVGNFVREEVEVNQILSLMVGREYNEEKAHQCCASYSSDPILKVENLRYKNIVKDISFELYPSEVLVLTGLVGAGRSELIEAVFGSRRISGGRVFLKGENVTGKGTKYMLQRGVSLVPEGRKIQGIFPQMSVEDNMQISALHKYRNTFGFLKTSELKKDIDNQIESLRVKTPSVKQLIRYLSGGNQQKVIVGRCLMSNPDILILDEPTNGIDVGTKQEIYKIIDRLSHEGVSIICISSEMAEVLTIADRVLVMREGKLTGDFKNDDSLTQDIIMAHAAQAV